MEKKDDGIEKEYDLLMKRTNKTKVTEAERLQLIGLLALAKNHNEKLSEIHEAVRLITGEEHVCGHSNDAVYAGYDADELLRNLGIAISA